MKNRNRFLKRGLDVAFAYFFLIFLSPVLAIAALSVKLTLRGPVIFKQKRAGLNGKAFIIYKFSTIECNSRISKFSDFLRRRSIDELPQLWNVLLGQMSVVGPRPHVLEQVKMYEPWQYRRLSAKPGITGLRQIECVKHDLDFNEKIELDLAYLDHWSLWLDFKIISRTFSGLLTRFCRENNPIDSPPSVLVTARLLR